MQCVVSNRTSLDLKLHQFGLKADEASAIYVLEIVTFDSFLVMSWFGCSIWGLNTMPFLPVLSI
jgi:hypothetical protein